MKEPPQRDERQRALERQAESRRRTVNTMTDIRCFLNALPTRLENGITTMGEEKDYIRHINHCIAEVLYRADHIGAEALENIGSLVETAYQLGRIHGRQEERDHR